MKQLFLLTLLGTLFTLSAYNQTVNITNCYIRYQYDDAGNRISRDFYCYYDPTYAKIMPRDSLQTIEDDIQVYPNPTADQFFIQNPHI